MFLITNPNPKCQPYPCLCSFSKIPQRIKGSEVGFRTLDPKQQSSKTPLRCGKSSAAPQGFFGRGLQEGTLERTSPSKGLWLSLCSQGHPHWTLHETQQPLPPTCNCWHRRLSREHGCVESTLGGVAHIPPGEEPTQTRAPASLGRVPGREAGREGGSPALYQHVTGQEERGEGTRAWPGG